MECNIQSPSSEKGYQLNRNDCQATVLSTAVELINVCALTPVTVRPRWSCNLLP